MENCLWVGILTCDWYNMLMQKRDVIIILSAVGVLVLVMLAWFAFFRQPSEEPTQEQQSGELTREEELRRENAAPRFEPLSEEEKAKLREENK